MWVCGGGGRQLNFGYGVNGEKEMPILYEFRRAVDFTNVKRVTFRAKGSTPDLRIGLVSDLIPNSAAADEIFDGLTDTTWSLFSINLDTDLINQTNSNDLGTWELMRKYITQIKIRTLDKNGTGGSGNITIDDVEIHFN